MSLARENAGSKRWVNPRHASNPGPLGVWSKDGFGLLAKFCAYHKTGVDVLWELLRSCKPAAMGVDG